MSVYQTTDWSQGEALVNLAAKDPNQKLSGGHCAPQSNNCAPVCPQPTNPCEEECDPCNPHKSIKIGFGIHYSGNVLHGGNLKKFNLRAFLVELILSGAFVASVIFFSICTCNTSDLLLAKFVFAFASGASLIAALEFATGYSHAHINSGYTLVSLILRNISLVSAISYIIAHILGAFIGAAIVLIFYSTSDCGFGVPVPGIEENLPAVVVPAPVMTPLPCYKVFLAEAFGTTALFTGIYFISTFGHAPSLGIGALFFVVTFMFAPFSGASFNFWRYIAPAVYAGIYECWWAYLVGFIAGVVFSPLVIWFICKCNGWVGRICQDPCVKKC